MILLPRNLRARCLIPIFVSQVYVSQSQICNLQYRHWLVCAYLHIDESKFPQWIFRIHCRTTSFLIFASDYADAYVPNFFFLFYRTLLDGPIIFDRAFFIHCLLCQKSRLMQWMMTASKRLNTSMRILISGSKLYHFRIRPCHSLVANIVVLLIPDAQQTSYTNSNNDACSSI